MKIVSAFLFIALLSSVCLGPINFSVAVSKTNSVEASTTLIPWSMFRHDSQHTGYTTSTSPSIVTSLWNFTTLGLAFSTSSPAVVNGKVYVGSDDNRIYALDQNTGAHIWNYTTGGDVHSSPAVADGRVFVGNKVGYLYALHEDTGALNWSKKLVNGEVYASPTVAYDKVFVTAFETSGSHYAYIFALNKDTGALIWNWKITITSYYYGRSMYVHSSPAVSGGLVFFGAHSQYSYYRSRVFALNATDGSIKWQSSIGGGNGVYIYSSPSVVEGSRVWIGNDDGYIYCLDYDTGALQWKKATGGAIRSSPAIAYGKVFVGSNDGKVYAYNQWSGNQVWNYTTGGAVRSSPAVADGKIIMGSDDGYLYALDESTGSLMWKFSLGGVVESSPAVADGLIFVGSNTGNVHAFGPRSRTPTKLQFTLTLNPAIVGQTITLLGNLTTDANLPIGAANVVVESNGTQVATLTTNSTGWFRASGPVGSVGTFNVTVEYAGSLLYLPSSAWKVLTVNKAETWIYAIFIPNPVTSGQNVTLRGILVDQFSKPIESANLTLQYSTNLGGNWTTAGSLATGSYGIFSETFTAPSLGTYIVRISYAGSAIHHQTTSDVPLIVK